jgi:hypothetical protein
MNYCLNCGIEVKKTEGKRPKKFCNNVCRATFHNKNKKKEPKYVLLSTHEAALKEREERINALEAEIRAISDTAVQIPQEASVKPALPKKQAPVVNIQNLTDDKNTNYQIDIKAQIEQLTTQMNHCGTGILGKKMKQNLQWEINALQKKLQ